KLDVMVSSLGDAKSLSGGTLLITPLKGADGQVYAVGQGAITVGGFAESTGGASTVKNHPTVGKVPGGATIEKELSFDFSLVKDLTYSLNNPDFTTANRLVGAINAKLRGKYARAQDSGTIHVIVPESYQDKIVNLVSEVEAVQVSP